MIVFYIVAFLIQHYYFYTTTNILQNQYYDIKRFFYYKMKNKPLLIIKILLVLLSCILIKINKIFYILSFFYFFDLLKNKIIKFKFTKRVIRQLILFEIINAFTLLITILFNQILLSILLNAIIYWFSFAISCFVEKIIQEYYKVKAIKKVKKYNIKIIAITGSYGKTSVKNYVYELIKEKYNVLMTPKSFNTLNGVLLTINNELKPYHEFLILEIGVDKKNGMNKFIKLFPFYISVVTAIGPQHLKTFKTMDNIKIEKLKIFTNATYCIVMNLDDKYIKDYTATIKSFTVSSNDEMANLIVNSFKDKNNDNILKIINDKKVYYAKTSLLGKHNIMNLSLAIAVAIILNINMKSIIKNIECLENVKHRLYLVKKENWIIIDDSYNSNYEGMLNAIDVLKEFTGFKVIITPGIIEAKLSDMQNSKIANKINENIDLALLINHPAFENKIDKKLAFISFKKAYSYLESNYKKEKLILLIANDLPDIYLN